MTRRGGSFGIVVLVVVLAIVLLLVARSWRAVAPEAIDVSGPGGGAMVLDDRGQTGAGDAVRSGELPDLREMQQNTDAHAQRVGDALAETE